MILRDVPLVQESDSAHPVLGAGLGPYTAQILGDAGRLTQFGVHLETLPQGSRSSFRHWHETEDEMVYILSGEVVLIEAAETTLHPGDVVCWPANHPVGHCLENRGASNASYLVIGSRKARDVIHYPDHDLISHKDCPARRYTDAQGAPRKG